MRTNTWLATGFAIALVSAARAQRPAAQGQIGGAAQVGNPVAAAYAAIWDGFYGTGKGKTLLKLSPTLQADGRPAFVVDEKTDAVSLLLRLDVENAAFEAWRQDAHRRLAALGTSLCSPVSFGTDGARIIGGRAFRFSGEGEACVNRWERGPGARKAAIAVRVEGLTAKGKKIGRWEAPIRLFNRTETNAFPRPLQNLNRLLDVPPSIWNWTEKGPDLYAASETAMFQMPLTGLSPRRAETIAKVQCTVMDEGDFMPELLETTDPAVLKLDEDMMPVAGRNFLIDRYEVTQALWEKVMPANPSKFKGPDLPVEGVSWEDCQTFLAKLNAIPAIRLRGLIYRLPTEAEWEYACRAGSDGPYCRLANGAEVSAEALGTVAWFRENSGQQTHPVGGKTPNAFGLYDMHGNVWEWTSTLEDIFRVTKGGGWDGDAGRCESANRNCFFPGHRYPFLGLRLAR